MGLRVHEYILSDETADGTESDPESSDSESFLNEDSTLNEVFESIQGGNSSLSKSFCTGISHKTIEVYQYCYRKFCLSEGLGRTSLKHIRREGISEFLDAIENVSNRRLVKTCLIRILRIVISEGILTQETVSDNLLPVEPSRNGTSSDSKKALDHQETFSGIQSCSEDVSEKEEGIPGDFEKHSEGSGKSEDDTESMESEQKVSEEAEEDSEDSESNPYIPEGSSMSQARRARRERNFSLLRDESEKQKSFRFETDSGSLKTSDIDFGELQKIRDDRGVRGSGNGKDSEKQEGSEGTSSIEDSDNPENSAAEENVLENPDARKDDEASDSERPEKFFVFLVDLENTSRLEWLADFIGDPHQRNYKIYIFYSRVIESVSIDMFIALGRYNVDFVKADIPVTDKNALDFQLVSYLGYLVHNSLSWDGEDKARHRVNPYDPDGFMSSWTGEEASPADPGLQSGTETDFYIVSKDNGYLAVCDFWKRTAGVDVSMLKLSDKGNVYAETGSGIRTVQKRTSPEDTGNMASGSCLFSGRRITVNGKNRNIQKQFQIDNQDIPEGDMKIIIDGISRSGKKSEIKGYIRRHFTSAKASGYLEAVEPYISHLLY